MKTFQVWAVVSAVFLSCGGRDGSDDHRSNVDVPAGAAPVQHPDAVVLRNLVPIDGLPVIGPKDALVTIVELTDYDCPYCARAEKTMQTLRASYGKDLRIAVAESPLPMHEHAGGAAMFALAANQAGVFQEAHEKLFADQTAHSDDDLRRLGESLGVAPALTTAPATYDALKKSGALADALHAHGTPTFFINGRKVAGAQTLETFTVVVDEELAHARSLVASGTPRAEVYDHILGEARAHPALLDDPADPPVFSADAKNASGALLMGNANAHQTILLFTDFECPYCARLDQRLRGFVAKHPDVRVVLRNKPLPMHSHARLAAKAALAADEQGKLGPYAEQLFLHQHELDRASLLVYAAEVGLNAGRFERDLDSDAINARLLEDDALGEKLGVTGTPTSFVEGNRVIGAQPEATFENQLHLVR